MKWIAILFGLFIVLVIVLADMGTLPHYLGLLNKIPYGDKAGHFMLYGILTLLIDLSSFRSLPSRRRKRVAFTTGVLLSVLIGLEELSQQYFSSRTFDLVDLSASYLGLIFFSWVALRARRTFGIGDSA